MGSRAVVRRQVTLHQPLVVSPSASHPGTLTTGVASTAVHDEERTIWSIPCPEGLNDEAWRAISGAVARLHGSRERDDIPAAIGAAKELCESVARVILAQRGHSLGSNASYDEVINTAHKAIERQPGKGLAADEDMRRIAQGAKTIACALGPMRNQRGTGHGRAHPPEVHEEHALIACDAAELWCRWALRRLGPYILGDVSALVNRLQQGTVSKGDLAGRLAAVDLERRDHDDAHLLGLAVGQRTVRETFNVRIEGVDAPIADPDAWPAAYRAGVIEGLMFSADGTLTTSPSAVDLAARLVAVHPTPTDILDRLGALAGNAGWTPPTVGLPPDLEEVVTAIQSAANRLPGALRPRWLRIATIATADGPPDSTSR
jgi:Abortive infection C-terminus